MDAKCYSIYACHAQEGDSHMKRLRTLNGELELRPIKETTWDRNDGIFYFFFKATLTDTLVAKTSGSLFQAPWIGPISDLKAMGISALS